MKSRGDRPRYRRAAARATAILDSVDFPTTGPVRWDDEQMSFVVEYLVDQNTGETRVKFLGPGPVAAVQAALRERSKLLAPERRARAAEGFAGFMQVVGAVAPIVGGVVGRIGKP